jgi:ABC-type multidrug transport system ATPase subunit
MPAGVIEVQGLTKTFGFRGAQLALDHVSFSVARGARFGLLGANGAGKTTLLRILSTTLRPVEGEARVGGHEVVEDRSEARKLVGFMPEDFDLSAWRTGRSYLRFWGRVSGLPPGDQVSRIEELAGFLELGSGLEADPRSSTIDVQKRLLLAQALLGNPEVLLLDEPFAGLGDVGRQFLVERIGESVRAGKTVILSSPLLADVRAACDQVAVFSEGRLVRVSGVSDLLVLIGKGRDARVFVDCEAPPAAAIEAVKGLQGVVDVQSSVSTTIVYITPLETDVDRIRETLEAHGVRVRAIRLAQLKLGDVFSSLHT